jgi:hypothetical protein
MMSQLPKNPPFEKSVDDNIDSCVKVLYHSKRVFEHEFQASRRTVIFWEEGVYIDLLSGIIECKR